MVNNVPLAVPPSKRSSYLSHLDTVTHASGRLFLFAGDQKVEHLNVDFFGEGISEEDNDPEHLFRIAARARIGVFATQLGLISRYGADYKKIPYLVKLNSKSHLVKASQKDPLSSQWITVPQVVEFKKNSRLNIVGVGYTVYVGSEYESQMLHEAAQIAHEAHLEGLLVVFWMYPRGKAVLDEKDPHLIAGAAGVGAALGADFAKVNYPRPLVASGDSDGGHKKEGISSAEALREAITAAGRTRVICAGGSSQDAEKFLKTLHDQIHISGAFGNATGRNIHQKNLADAIRFCNAIYEITVKNKSVEVAMKVYKNKP